jgi:hypothetical protein
MTEKESLQNLIRHFPDFETWHVSKQLPLMAWFLLRFSQKDEFSQDDIWRCLKQLDIPFSYLLPVQLSNCADIVKTEHGYKLHWRTRDKFNQQLLNTATSIEIHKLLKALPAKIPIAKEKIYLAETITCYRYGAYRAAIVMCWNLAFSHLCNFILKDTSHRTAFNQELLKKFTKAKAINAYDDFSPYRESDVLDVCYAAKLVNKNQYKILKEKLDTRNMAAHPSTVTFTQVDVESYILTLINNVVLTL